MPLTPEQRIQNLYDQLAEADAQVAAAKEAYEAASAERGRVILALSRRGQSTRKIADRLGKSPARVDQLIARARKAS